MGCTTGNLPYFSAPVATFAVFTALPRSEFTISKAFTSLTLISLLEQSAVMFISSLPAIASAFGCFSRLEAFLASIDSSTPQDPSANQQGTLSETRDLDMANIEKTVEVYESDPTAPLFNISNATFGTTGGGSFQLKNMNISISPNSFVGVTGPSGCGKTLLITALLKRTPCIAGTCSISNVPFAYCSQIPWLCNGTIRETIVGHTKFDETWYKRVVSACALEHDIETIGGGDESIVGSQGSTLSGGQKQRVVSVSTASYLPNPMFVWSSCTWI
jgi:ATP-binding cassette subfamily C (CFTR/MRP) protein 1